MKPGTFFRTRCYLLMMVAALCIENDAYARRRRHGRSSLPKTSFDDKRPEGLTQFIFPRWNKDGVFNTHTAGQNSLAMNTMDKANLSLPGGAPHIAHTKAAEFTVIEDSHTLPLELLPPPSRMVMEEQEQLARLEREEQEDTVELQLENSSLDVLVEQIRKIFDIEAFILPETLQPIPGNGKKLSDSKISFKTYKPLPRAQAWDLFLLFLKMAGFTVVKGPESRIYKIESIELANKSAIPVYIGTDYHNLPDNDTLIRYVYFVENGDLNTLSSVVDALRSPSSREAIKLQDNKAFIITDHAHNIRAIMQIIAELDKVNTPRAMSVLKLRRANADEVKALYDSINPPQAAPQGQFINQRKSASASYFSDDLKIFVEPRTNSLILLGSRDAIARVEEFVIKHIDTELDQPYSPLYPYHLKFADAKKIAEVMNAVTKFGNNAEYPANISAGKAGGVRGNDKFMRPMVFIPEPETNTLIIKGDYRDYLVARSIIAELDEEQPQVALEVLIIALSATEVRELGAQLRTKKPGTEIFGNNVEWQTSGLRAGSTPRGIQENPTGPGVDRLLGNLLQLITTPNPLAGPGNTIVTLGQDFVAGKLGVWGILQVLQTVSNAQVVANPFLIAANNTKATTSIGETRRVVSSLIFNGGTGNQSESAFQNYDANLNVTFVPQINADGRVILDMSIVFDEFTNPVDFSSGTKITRTLTTKVTTSNEEILALGGFIRSRADENLSKVPFLADVPILGWFWKNKRKATTEEHLLILISTKIIEPERVEDIDEFTQDHIAEYQQTLSLFNEVSVKRDPIDRSFFNPLRSEDMPAVEQLIFARQKKVREIAQQVAEGKEGSGARIPLTTEREDAPEGVNGESRLARKLRSQKNNALFFVRPDPMDEQPEKTPERNSVLPLDSMANKGMSR